MSGNALPTDGQSSMKRKDRNDATSMKRKERKSGQRDHTKSSKNDE